jgi:transglutaminase-like putative cysteine protease
MLLRLGYDLEYQLPAAVPMVALLNLHPSRAADARQPDQLRIEALRGVQMEPVPFSTYLDTFGNVCTRFVAPAGRLRLWNDFTLEDPGEPDSQPAADAPQVPVEELPPETLRFLLASRYCEVDQLQPFAEELFGRITGGTARVHAICNWINWKMVFAYGSSRPTKTAKDALVERIGVCRDFQHLAVTFCRCMNIPARYVTGYLGDIRVPPSPTEMDFSAWFEVWIGDRWWAMDARHNVPRIGRTLMAVGRDAADVAITTAFGNAPLTRFVVTTEEITD